MTEGSAKELSTHLSSSQHYFSPLINCVSFTNHRCIVLVQSRSFQLLLLVINELCQMEKNTKDKAGKTNEKKR